MVDMKKDDSGLLTIPEVMAMLRLSRPTVIRMVQRGTLRGIKAGWQWRVFADSVTELLNGKGE